MPSEQPPTPDFAKLARELIDGWRDSDGYEQADPIEMATALREAFDAGQRCARQPPAETLRDRFALAALPGLMAEPTIYNRATNLAQAAYRIADAMLAAREEP